MKITKTRLIRILLITISIGFLGLFNPGSLFAAVTLQAPSYSLTNFSVGSIYYSDRSYTITSQPAGFENFTAIKTKNDDKSNTSTSFVRFTLSTNSTVYVAFDRRATGLPSWLSGFTATGQRVNVTDGGMGYFNLYKKNYPAGQVTLGGARCCGGANVGSNYIVY